METPGGSGVPCVGARVVAELYSDGQLAYDANGDVPIGSVASLTTNLGRWSLTLEPNANIEPTGTVWQIEIQPPDGETSSFYIEVPDTAGPHDAVDLLAEEPGALPSQALQTHTSEALLHDHMATLDVERFADIHAALAAASAAGGGMVVLSTPGGTATTQTVVVPTGVGLRMEPGCWLQVGSAVTVGVKIDRVARGARCEHLDVRRTPAWYGASPTDSTSVGVQILDTSTSKIDISRVSGFVHGLQFRSVAGGCAYNVATLGEVNDCKFGLDFLADLPGYSNENTVIGGRVVNSSSANNGAGGPVSGSAYVRFSELANDNRIIAVSLEGDKTERSVLCAGSYNLVQHCRFESAAPAEFTETALLNLIAYGYAVFGHNDHIADLPDDVLEIIDAGEQNSVHGYGGVNGYSSLARGGLAGFSSRATSSDVEVQFLAQNVAGATVFSVVGTGDVDASGFVRPGRYATGARPSASSVGAGAMIYDSTLSKPVWSNGTVWKDAAGTTV